MDFNLSEDLRKDLRKALSRHGCQDAEAAAVLIEDLAEAYHQRFIGPREIPEAGSLAEASRMMDCADLLRCELVEMNDSTRRRMARALETREEELTLPRYVEAVNDVCMFALYATDRGAVKAMRSNRPADRELRRLFANVMKIWRLRTGCEVPEPPGADHPDRNWRYARRLEQHPIWIVAQALGIHLDSYSVGVLIKSVQLHTEQDPKKAHANHRVVKV